MIKLVDVKVSFGVRPILDSVNWMLGDSDRAGLVGENGSGKSTLLKVLAKLQEVDRGAIEISGGLKIGYLPQQGVTHHGRTLEQEARSALSEVLELDLELKDIQKKLKDPEMEDAERDQLLERMGELMDRFQIHGGYEMESTVAKVLTGLGFSEDDRKKPVESFSGGWQMRIALAKLLLARPHALLLDEPTNHLDLEARNWLEAYLHDYPYSYLIVSHDRYFLDVTAERITEVADGRLDNYRGNYSYFVEERRKKVELAQAAYEKQQEEINRLKAFINKYRADKKRTGQVHSRMKRLDKIDVLEPPRDTAPIHFQFPDPPRGPQVVIRLDGVEAGYGDKTVLKDVDLAVIRGEKVAVVGHNGAGKTTLLKAMAERLKLRRGEVEIGPGVFMAYFGQDSSDELTGDETVLEFLERGAPLDMQPRLRNLLGAFLFSGEDVDKKVRVLSGGEKSRLSLAKLLLRPANLLLLDEPTNHLDLRAKEVLMGAFKNFAGALIFVAHDRYFLEDLPDRVVEVDNSAVNSYPGDYSDYLRAKEREERDLKEEEKEKKKKKAAPPPSESADPAAEKEKRIKERELKKAEKKERDKVRKRMYDLEWEIERLETELAELDEKLAAPDNSSDYVKLVELGKDRDALQKKIDALLREWEELAAEQEEENGG